MSSRPIDYMPKLTSSKSCRTFPSWKTGSIVDSNLQTSLPTSPLQKPSSTADFALGNLQDLGPFMYCFPTVLKVTARFPHNQAISFWLYKVTRWWSDMLLVQ